MNAAFTSDTQSTHLRHRLERELNQRAEGALGLRAFDNKDAPPLNTLNFEENVPDTLECEDAPTQYQVTQALLNVGLEQGTTASDYARVPRRALRLSQLRTIYEGKHQAQALNLLKQKRFLTIDDDLKRKGTHRDLSWAMAEVSTPTS